MNEIKKAFDMYCTLIGLRNEGYKRVLSLLIVIATLILFIYGDTEDLVLRTFSGNQGLFEAGDMFLKFFSLSINLFLSFFVFGVLIKIYTWVRSGFDQQ